jgi:hypothetical protein
MLLHLLNFLRTLCTKNTQRRECIRKLWFSSSGPGAAARKLTTRAKEERRRKDEEGLCQADAERKEKRRKEKKRKEKKMKERSGEKGLTAGSGYFNLPTVGLNGLRSPFSVFFFFLGIIFVCSQSGDRPTNRKNIAINQILTENI